jgi:uroporphyrinogen decarboxylase
MSRSEQALQLADAADVYIATARHYGHAAIFVHYLRGVPDAEAAVAACIREKTGNEFFLMRHGDATLGIPDGTSMMDFSYRLADEPGRVKQEQLAAVQGKLAAAEEWAGAGLFDGFALCTDYCFNSGPFLSPNQFSEFVTPYLAQLVREYRAMGYYVIKHTDGNILPIIDQLVACRPHALHSLDPQAGVDIAEIKRRYGDQVCLCGNVDCGLMQTGTDEEVDAAARYALRHGMPGGGYVFCTSNCVYPGMPLGRYDRIIDTWRREGVYGQASNDV